MENFERVYKKVQNRVYQKVPHKAYANVPDYTCNNADRVYEEMSNRT